MTEDLYNRARYAFLAGDYDQAENLAVRYLDTKPQDTDGRLFLAAVYTKEGKYTAAASILAAVCAEQPGNAEAWINSAIVHQKLGRLKTALKHARKAYRLSGSRGDIICRIGTINRRLGDSARAEQIYRIAIEKQADYIPSYSKLAELLCESGKKDEAERVLKKGLQIDENEPELHCCLGKLLSRSGNSVEAEKAFSKALKIKPGYEDCLLSLGDLKKDDQPSEAERLYNRALDLSPDSADALCRIGEIRFAQQRPDEAEEIFESILEDSPGHLPATLNLAAALYSGRKLEQAESLCRKNIDGNINFRLILGNILLDTGRYAEAANHIRFFLDREPGDCRAWFALARQLRLSGKINKAINTYQKGLKIEPEAHEDRIQLALLLMNENRFKDAIRECEYVRNGLPGEAAPRVMLAELYLKTGAYAKAVKLLRELAAERPGDLKTLRMLAEAADKAGDSETALWAAERIAGIAPDEDLSIEHLNESLDLYDEMAKQYAADFGGSWKRNLKKLAGTIGERPQPEDSGDFILENFNDLGEETVPILDVGGIDPVIMFDEDEEILHISEESEYLPPPEDDEAETPVERETEKITERQDDPQDAAARQNPDTEAVLRSDAQPMSFKLDIPTITIRKEPPNPQPEPGAPPRSPKPHKPASGGKTSDRHEETANNLFGYLDRLTEYLPANKRAEYRGSEIRLKLAALKSRIDGDPGLLERVKAEPESPDEIELTRDRIGRTLGFMSSLSSALPDSEISSNIKDRIDNILSRLDSDGSGDNDEKDN